MTHRRTSIKTRIPARMAIAALAAVASTGGMVALTGPAHAAGTALPANCTTTGYKTGAFTTTCTFAYTGAAQQLTVPSGVSAVSVTADGGHGATPAAPSSGIGGRGARVTGSFAVAAGDQLNILVAGDARGSVGGFGYGTGGTSAYSKGGGGGGASSISKGSTLLVVAAGGGGGGVGSGFLDSCGTGGAGGNARSTGQQGQVTAPACLGAKGGAGGAAGAAANANGETAPNTNGEVGGAGGAGYVGGKAGASGGGAVVNGLLQYLPGGGGGGGTVWADQKLVYNLLLSAISDRVAGQNGQVTVTFDTSDTSAPVGQPRVTPLPMNGWSNSPVTVDWGWSDSGAGINPDACAQQTQPGHREGIYTVSATCADMAGNTITLPFTIRQDETAPVAVNPIADTIPDKSVTVNWNWSDDTSGVDPAHCTQTSTAVAPHWSGTLTATCFDRAGNSTTVSRNYQLDTEAPDQHTAITPAPNAAGWNNSDVTIDWGYFDTGAGVDPTNCTQQTTIAAEGHTEAYSACSDVLGHETESWEEIYIDKTVPVAAPVVTATATGATVDWNWTDPGYVPDTYDASGIDPEGCSQASTQTGTGALTFTSTCADVAGNIATKTVTVPQRADVKVAVTGTKAVKKGSSYTYTVTVTNNGPGVASNVISEFSWPAGATLVSVSGTPVKTASSSTWTTASLASGASKTFTVKLTFTTTGTKALTATASSQGKGSTPATPDNNTGNNQSQLTATVS